MTLIIVCPPDGIWRGGSVAWVVSGSGGESGAVVEWTGTVAQDELRGIRGGESKIAFIMVPIGSGSSGDGYSREMLTWM